MEESSGPDWTGQTHGDFEVTRLLGQGGMGRVYLARQMSLDRLVADVAIRSFLRILQSALCRTHQQTAGTDRPGRGG